MCESAPSAHCTVWESSGEARIGERKGVHWDTV
jgi:hypothetical protein